MFLLWLPTLFLLIFYPSRETNWQSLKRALLHYYYLFAMAADKVKTKKQQQQPQHSLNLKTAAVVDFGAAVAATLCQSNLAVPFVASPLVVVLVLVLVVVDIVESVVTNANGHIFLSRLLVLAAGLAAVAVSVDTLVSSVPTTNGHILPPRRVALDHDDRYWYWYLTASTPVHVDLVVVKEKENPAMAFVVAAAAVAVAADIAVTVVPQVNGRIGLICPVDDVPAAAADPLLSSVILPWHVDVDVDVAVAVC